MIKKTKLYVPVLWSVNAVIWGMTLCMDLINGDTPAYLIALRCACVILSGVAAVINFVKYARSRNED